MDDLLGPDDDEKTGAMPPMTLRAPQNSGIGVQHGRGRPLFQEDDRQRNESNTEDTRTPRYDSGLFTNPLPASIASPMLPPTLDSNPLDHQGTLMGLNDLIRLQQSQQGYLQQGSGQSRPEEQLQLETTDQNPSTMPMPSAGRYQVYTGTASNQEVGSTSPLPQPRPLGPMTERLLQAASPSRASFQASNPPQPRPQHEQLQQDKPPLLPAQLAGLQQATPILTNRVLPHGFQLPLNAMNQAVPPGSLINVNAGIKPPPPFPPSILNPNFANSLGATVFPSSAALMLPIPLREQPHAIPSQSTGKKPIALYMNCDDDSLSPYQCLVRKHIELFEADRDEVEGNAKGRNKPIVLGQVGIRCRHCSTVPAKNRGRGSKYYPAKLSGLYQAAQSMASGHLCNYCNQIPQPLRAEMLILREKKSSAGGGKKYWADGVRVLGVVEDEHGLRFKKPSR